MAPVVQPADSTSRRRLIWWLVLAAAFGVIALGLFERLQEWVMDDPSQIAERAKWLIVSLLLPILPMLVGCAHIWRLGGRVVAEQRFPPQGVSVIRDTLVVEAGAAVTRGRVMQVLSVVLAIACVLPPLVLWVLLVRLGGVP